MRLKDFVPEGLSLRPYQLTDLKLLVSRKRNLLKWDMGLGKTPVSVVAANVFRKLFCARTLVIAPSSMKHTWKDEFEKWSVLPHNVLVVKGGKATIPSDTDVVIISYDTAKKKRWYTLLAKWLKSGRDKTEPGFLILDESHFIRKWSSARTKNIFNYILPHASRLLLLTGTPMLNNISDLHPQFSACAPGKWGKLIDFSYEYSYPQPNPWSYSGVDFVGTRNVPALRKKAASFLIRRFKKDVLKDLPEKMLHYVYCEVTPSLAKATLRCSEQIIKAILEGREVPAHAMPTERKQLGLEKVPAACAWIDEFFEAYPSESLVVFAYHKDVIRLLLQHALEKKYMAESLTGETSAEERHKIKTRFQAGHTQLLIANILAGGVGLTLTRANTALFVELEWSPLLLKQAEDRLHRLTQHKPVNIFYLLAEDSIDDKVIGVIKRKLRDADTAVGV